MTNIFITKLENKDKEGPKSKEDLGLFYNYLRDGIKDELF